MVNQVSDAEVDGLVKEYDDSYAVQPDLRPGGSQCASLREAARIELGMRAFLEQGGFKAFTTTFEDLHGLAQLPGLAVQRLMADGYGFGAEGDWKTSALVRAMKVMGAGLAGGTSFMEDYTYHLDPAGMKVLGAHMLEVCASIAAGKPSLRNAPAVDRRQGRPGPPGVRYPHRPGDQCLDHGYGQPLPHDGQRGGVVPTDAPLPKLPVARALWVPQPDLQTAAAAWIYAGGAHHTGFSQAVTAEHLEDFAEMAGMEFLLIDRDTKTGRVQERAALERDVLFVGKGAVRSSIV